jgi:RimJ/RimL family protein N-acetyltransferase
MTVLTTTRLRLEPCNASRLDGLFAINSDAQVTKYLSGRHETRLETLLMIQRVEARWAERGYSWWSFVERTSEEIVGAGCIQNLRKQGANPDPACPLEIGWRLRRDRWGQGLASEAAIAMADFAFNTLHAERLCAVCKPENSASEAVMKRLGMRSRGVEQWYEMDVTTYEMTRAEWEERHLACKRSSAAIAR